MYAVPAVWSGFAPPLEVVRVRTGHSVESLATSHVWLAVCWQLAATAVRAG